MITKTKQNQNIWRLPKTEIRRQRRRGQVVSSYVQPLAQEVLIDVGCGEGFITNYFKKAGNVVGLDLSKKSLIMAKQKLPWSNIEFICADACYLPLKEDSFDKAVVLEILSIYLMKINKSFAVKLQLF